MLKVGLTGGIGAGKSVVAKIFEILGSPIYQADEAAKRLMETNQLLVEKIKEKLNILLFLKLSFLKLF